MTNSAPTKSHIPFLVAAILAFALIQPAAARQRAAARVDPSRPRLLVVFVVDQFRRDYVDMYGGKWTSGLREILGSGAYFPNAAYPYAGTKTCAGHASIGTGTLPSTHGLIDNEWFDMASHEFTTCTEDPNARAFSYGSIKAAEHHSARWMRATTLADALTRTSPQSRVVSLSVKPRSAIGLGGHGGPTSTFVWNEETTSTWATSSAFATAASPLVAAFIKAHPFTSARGTQWGRTLTDPAYQGRDDGPGEPAPSVFPHWLDEPIRTSRTSGTFADVWEQSPLPDAYLADLAATLIAKLRLGQQDTTDFLAIGFSSLDAVGHRYGPRSHEVQDTLAKLDRVIGQLIATLDRAVGRERYVVALSADHGVADMPEQAVPASNAGRITLAPLGNAVEDALDRTLGRADYVEAIASASIYFRRGMLAKVRANPAAVAAAEAALRNARGIARVFWSDELASNAPTSDEMLPLLRRSYVAGRSGDLAFVLKPNWVAVATGTSHGTPYEYDTQVPVAFFGAGVAPGRYPGLVTPIDIAPTLASLAGIALARTDGHVLSEALKAR